MQFKKQFEDTLLPSFSNSCAVSPYKCTNIFISRATKLYPLRVINIPTELTVDLPQGYILRVKNHLCDKPYRVVVDRLIPDESTKTLTIPIITQRKCELKRGDILCHLQPQSINQCFTEIKGNSFFIVT